MTQWMDDVPWADISKEIVELKRENKRLLRCINMAMGCITPLSRNVDERLAWYRLADAIQGKEPRAALASKEPT